MSLLTANQCVPTSITVAQDGAGKGDLIKISLEQSISRKITCSTMYPLSHVTFNCLFSSPIPVVQYRARKGDLFKISLEEMFLTKRPLVECLTVDLEEKNKTLSTAKTKAVTAEFKDKFKSPGMATTKPRKSRKTNSFPSDMTAPSSFSRELRSPSIFSETGSRESKASATESSPIPTPKITKKKTAPCSNWQRGICNSEQLKGDSMSFANIELTQYEKLLAPWIMPRNCSTPCRFLISRYKLGRNRKKVFKRSQCCNNPFCNNPSQKKDPESNCFKSYHVEIVKGGECTQPHFPVAGKCSSQRCPQPPEKR